HPIHSLWKISTLGMSAASPDCIVLLEQSGFVDYARIHDTFSFTEIVRAKLQDAEQVLAAVNRIEKKTGKQAYLMLVIDADGMEYTKQLIDLMRGPMGARSDFMLRHYVELVKYIVVVNVPAWAWAVWAMVKPMLPEQTRDKLRLLSSNWREEIQTLIDPSICPVFWNDENHGDFEYPLERP
ncbi:hypothetical protein PENTCL1PPCAC_14508, partial [Pristionchus entomophagus]